MAESETETKCYQKVRKERPTIPIELPTSGYQMVHGQENVNWIPLSLDLTAEQCDYIHTLAEEKDISLNEAFKLTFTRAFTLLKQYKALRQSMDNIDVDMPNEC